MRFQFRKPEKPAPAKIPKVSKLLAQYVAPAPPETVLRQLGMPCIIMGVDIETNDFVLGKKPFAKGQFGHWCFCTPADLKFKLIQIGWAIGDCKEDAPVECKELTVRPEGFLISGRAIAKHGITNELAAAEGLPLHDVLKEFMRAAIRVYDMGGRVVIHHLEFDAGVIDEELRVAGLDLERLQWHMIANRGICTLDLDLWKWVQHYFGREQERGDKAHVLSLQDAVKLLLPRSSFAKALMEKHHTAGADAQLHRILYIAFHALVNDAFTHNAKP